MHQSVKHGSVRPLIMKIVYLGISISLCSFDNRSAWCQVEDEMRGWKNITESKIFDEELYMHTYTKGWKIFGEEASC